MNFLISLPAIRSFFVRGAHFLRHANHAMMAVCLAAPLLLVARRSWAVKLVQAILVLGALLWIRTIIILIDQRDAAGAPLLRMAIILGAVALFTFASALLLMLFRVRSPHEPSEKPAAYEGTANMRSLTSTMGRR